MRHYSYCKFDLLFYSSVNEHLSNVNRFVIIYSAHFGGEATTLSPRVAGLCAVLQSLSPLNGGRGQPPAAVREDLRFGGQ